MIFQILSPATPLRELPSLPTHLERISSTVLYAEAQDNNHWTSEAAALFIGGSWLASESSYALAGSQWAKTGRRALECSVNRLVLQDGSFAQHSLTYHRLLLDTLVQVELWRRLLALDPSLINSPIAAQPLLPGFLPWLIPSVVMAPIWAATMEHFVVSSTAFPTGIIAQPCNWLLLSFMIVHVGPMALGTSICIGMGLWGMASSLTETRMIYLVHSRFSRMEVTP